MAGATDDDLHLALYCCYELHYRGFAGIDDRWEWDSGLLAFRDRLEQALLAELIDEVGPPAAVADIATELHAIVNGGDGPSLSGYMAERGTAAEFREFAIHRSAYQLKEADPHTWVIPRLAGTAKAALLEIQTDEYGSGRLEAMHSTLFARTMRCLGLDPTYGTYLAALPGVTLATVNLISFFGLHRRWRGALTRASGGVRDGVGRTQRSIQPGIAPTGFRSRGHCVLRRPRPRRRRPRGDRGRAAGPRFRRRRAPAGRGRALRCPSDHGRRGPLYPATCSMPGLPARLPCTGRGCC